MQFANYKFPQGLFTDAQKEEIVHKTTDLFASYFEEASAPTRRCCRRGSGRRVWQG